MDAQPPTSRPRLSKRISIELLRTFTRSVSESRAEEKRPPLPASPYSLSLPTRNHTSTTPGSTTPLLGSARTSSSASTSTTPPRAIAAVYDAASLPEERTALEALLNENTLQLQRLADRVESVNEWMETDGITLTRLQRDLRHQARKASSEATTGRKLVAAKEKKGAKWLSAADSVSPRSFSPFSLPAPVTGTVDTSERNIGDTLSSQQILELTKRIRGMKAWKRDLERSVVWRREEGWAVRAKMGLVKEDERPQGFAAADGEEGRVGGWGVGGRTWERGTGRVPTQREWEGLLTDRTAVEAGTAVDMDERVTPWSSCGS